MPPLQLLVQRAEKCLVAALGEHGHPPGKISVKGSEHAFPAGRDDRVVEVPQRAHHKLEHFAVAVGQVAHPDRGSAGPVSPHRGHLLAQVRAGGGAHEVEGFGQVGGG